MRGMNRRHDEVNWTTVRRVGIGVVALAAVATAGAGQGVAGADPAGLEVGPHAASGRNGCAFISVTGGPVSGWNARAEKGCGHPSDPQPVAHVQLTGPGRVNVNGPDDKSYGTYVVGRGYGAGQVCSSVWQKTRSGHTLIGRACQKVY